MESLPHGPPVVLGFAAARSAADERTCVLNFAGGGWYPRGQRRLVNSFRAAGYTGDFLLWDGVLPPGSPPHAEVPFAFKAHALAWALARGYRRLIWADASIVAVRRLDGYLAAVDRLGQVLGRTKYPTGEYASDACLAAFGVKRDQAMALHDVASGLVAFDAEHAGARRLLDRWIDLGREGTLFKGAKWNEDGSVSKDPRVRGHRHDQSVLSLLVAQAGAATVPWASIARERRKYRVRATEYFAVRRLCPAWDTGTRSPSSAWRAYARLRGLLSFGRA